MIAWVLVPISFVLAFVGAWAAIRFVQELARISGAERR